MVGFCESEGSRSMGGWSNFPFFVKVRITVNLAAAICLSAAQTSRKA